MDTVMQYSDIELFEIFKTGSTEAFEQIYLRHWPGLIKEARRLIGGEAEAKDIVQDTFVSLYQKADAIDIKYSLRAYLSQTLKYKAINRRRDQGIHNCCHYDIYYRSKSETVFSDRLESKELSLKLHSAIAGLPNKCKQVFLLSREEGYSHKFISKELNISTSTVEKHIGKALKILRQKLRTQFEFA